MKCNKFSLVGFVSILVPILICTLGYFGALKHVAVSDAVVTTSMIFAFIVFPIISLVAGIVSFIMIKKSGEKGHLMSVVSVTVAVVILAFVWLASSSECGINARCKGRDAASKSSLNQIVILIESDLSAGSRLTYAGSCADPKVSKHIRVAEGLSASRVECNDSEDSFALQVKLRSGGYYCLDAARNNATSSAPIPGALKCN